MTIDLDGRFHDMLYREISMRRLLSSDKGAYQSGRGAPQSQGGGAVTSPTPTGPGRGDNQ
jgi:hypothetical protein